MYASAKVQLRSLLGTAPGDPQMRHAMPPGLSNLSKPHYPALAKALVQLTECPLKMPASLPSTIASQLNDKINTLFLKTESYLNENDFAIHNLSAEAKKLIKADACAGHLALAKIYHVCGNVEKMLHHFDVAQRLSNTIQADYNAATCMVNLGLFSKAQRYFAIIGDPTAGYFKKEFSLGLCCGAFNRLRLYLEQAQKMKLDFSGIPIETMLRAQAVLAAGGITDENVAAVLDFAGEVMREERFFFEGEMPDIAIDDGPFDVPHCVYLTFKVKCSGTEAARLSSTLFGKIAERLDHIPDQLHVAFGHV